MRRGGCYPSSSYLIVIWMQWRGDGLEHKVQCNPTVLQQQQDSNKWWRRLGDPGWATVLIPHKCKLLLLLYSTCTHRPHQPCHEWCSEEVFLFVMLLYVCFNDSEERQRLGRWAIVPSPKILYVFTVHLIKRLLTNYSYPAPSVSCFEGFALHRFLRLLFRVTEEIHTLHRFPSPVSRDSRPHRSLRHWKRETEGFVPPSLARNAHTRGWSCLPQLLLVNPLLRR